MWRTPLLLHPTGLPTGFLHCTHSPTQTKAHSFKNSKPTQCPWSTVYQNIIPHKYSTFKPPPSYILLDLAKFKKAPSVHFLKQFEDFLIGLKFKASLELKAGTGTPVLITERNIASTAYQFLCMPSLHWNLLQGKSMNWVPVGTQLYAGCLGITNGSWSVQFC